MYIYTKASEWSRTEVNFRGKDTPEQAKDGTGDIVCAYDVTKTRVERQATTPTPLVGSANITPLAY